MSKQPTPSFQFKPPNSTHTSGSTTPVSTTGPGSLTRRASSPQGGGQNEFLLPGSPELLPAADANTNNDASRLTPLNLPSPLQRALGGPSSSRSGHSSGSNTPSVLGLAPSTSADGSSASSSFTIGPYKPSPAPSSSTGIATAGSSPRYSSHPPPGGHPSNTPSLSPQVKPASITSTNTNSTNSSNASMKQSVSFSRDQPSPAPSPQPASTLLHRMTSTNGGGGNTDKDWSYRLSANGIGGGNEKDWSNTPSDKVPLLSAAAPTGKDFSNDDSDHPKSSNIYYEQYEATVNKIRARRSAEAAAKLAKSALKTPEQTRKEVRMVGVLFTMVLAVVALIIYVLYPRIPLFLIEQVDIQEMRLWSDGTADFSILTHVSIHNANFMSTGVDSIVIKVSHNDTDLGTATLTDVKLNARQENSLEVTHDFSADEPLTPVVFAGLFEELSDTSGQLTFQYDLSMVTSESFRLRSIQVSCETIIQITTVDVPPTAQVVSNDCTHTEQTG